MSQAQNSIAVGLASGMGNTIFMLPAIKALKLKGHRIALYIQTDFPVEALWRRCIYADEILDPSMSLNGHKPYCGQWRPAAWSVLPQITRQLQNHPFTMPEWQSNMRIAGKIERLDVTDWCRGLDRTKKYDIGIVPGSKGGIWLRKRYPAIKDVAAFYLAQGKRVAVFGLDDDGVAEVPGEAVATENMAILPDALASCRVVIGTDSGVTQLASSLGIPVVIIFTATSAVKGEPVGPHTTITPSITCSPCQSTAKWFACNDWKCREIDTMRVINAANELLDRSTGDHGRN